VGDGGEWVKIRHKPSGKIWRIAMALCALSALSLSTLALAQPPDQASGIMSRDAMQVAREWATLRAANLDEETTDPHAAIARYQKFYEERGHLDGGVSVAITSLIAQIYLQNLHDRDKALKIYDWGVQQFSWHPAVARLKAEREWVQANRKPDVAPLVAPPVAPPAVPATPIVPLHIPQGQAPTMPTAIAPPSIAPAPVAPIRPAAANVPPAIHLGALVVPPLTVPGAPVPVPQPSGVSSPIPNPALALARVAFVTQLQAEPGDAEALWKASGLNADALPALLAQAEESNAAHKAARLALAGLLVRHDPELLQAPEKLGHRVRLALADYYASTHDEKAVAIYESLLAEVEKGGPQPREVFEVDKLAEYYKSAGQIDKAAEVMARAGTYTTVPALVGNGWVEAARLYRQAGEDEKADALYRKVITTSSEWGWAKGLAIYDWASTLIAEGKYEEARKLLKTPVTGQYAEQTRIPALCLLGFSYFQTQDFAMARQYSQEAITQYEALKNPLQNEGLQEIVEAAKNRLQTMAEWKDKIFDLPLKRLVAQRGVGGTYHARLYVHSFQDRQVAVHFADNAVQLVSLTQQSHQRTETGVVVTIYDLAYRVDHHPANLKAQVSAAAKPQEAQSIELHLQEEDEDQ
jgi:tetratricopeptide (TPR) repeat protein